MSSIKSELNNGTLTVSLTGHIDSANAPVVESEITNVREKYSYDELVLDAGELEYISSAGLRIILRLRKENPNLRIINVSNEVYEVFDMTGFTEMVSVEKSYRNISVEGCTVIGKGANGEVYRIDRDTIVKVYFNKDSLPDIKRERELARTAFILGVPTAIPYDVVKVGDGYGSVFELLDAKSYAMLLIDGIKTVEEIADMSAELLKKIHSTEVKEGLLPSVKQSAIKWADFSKDYLPAETAEKLVRLIGEIPESNFMLHGDFHIKNVLLQNGESLLIDMDTLCVGHPVFEFASMYNAFVAYPEFDHDNTMMFFGIEYETGIKLWNDTVKAYFADFDEKASKEAEEKAIVIAGVRLMRRLIRNGSVNNEIGKKTVNACINRVTTILDKLDSLYF